MRPKMRWSAFLFPFVLVLLLSTHCFVSDIYAADSQEKTVTVKFISYNGTDQVIDSEVTRTINNGDTVMIQVPALSDYPGGWNARGWADSPEATSGGIDPEQIQTLWIADDMTYYGVYERQVELTFETGSEDVQAPGKVSCQQFVNSSDVTRTYGGQTFRLPPEVSRTDADFGGWVVKDSNGAKYPPGSWAIIDLHGAGGATMQAVWEPVIYTIHYDRNGSTGPAPSDQQKTVGKPIALAEMTRDKMVLKGWARTSSNPIPQYPVDTLFNDDDWFNADRNLTLYAVWHYGISYDANADDGEVVENVPENVTVKHTIDPTTLSAQKPERQGYAFRGWAGSADATVADYPEGHSFAPLRETLYLYAVWARIYTVTYDYEINLGAPATSEEKVTDTVIVGEEVDLTPMAEREGEGWEFAGWNENRNAHEAMGPFAMPERDVTLYAIYQKTLTATFLDYGGEPTQVSETIYNRENPEGIVVPALTPYPGWSPRGWTQSETADFVPLNTFLQPGPLVIDSDRTYYGVYHRILSLNYNAGDGSSEMLSDLRKSGTQCVNSSDFGSPDPNNPWFVVADEIEKESAGFVCWALNGPDGTRYDPGDPIIISDNSVLYAVWEDTQDENDEADVILGMYYFGGWSVNNSPSLRDPWTKTSSTVTIREYCNGEREPLRSWYDLKNNQELVNEQLEWMIQYGIDFISFAWYWNADHVVFANAPWENWEPDYPALDPETAIRAYWQTDNSSRIPYTLLWCNEGTSPSPRTSDEWEEMIEYWIDRHLSNPKYYKIDGKPAVFIISPKPWMADVIGMTPADMLQHARDKAIEKGLEGIYFVVCTDLSQVNHAMQFAPDALTGYSYRSPAWTSYAADLDGNPQKGYRGIWNGIMTNATVPFFVPMSAGRDETPWGGGNVPCMPTPDEFETHLRAGYDVIIGNMEKTKGIGMLYAWDEYGEGGFIEPTRVREFEFLERIHRVFRSGE